MLHESFADRLMKKHEFTERSANRLEFEYRRFLYLKAIDGSPLTPSSRVDQAWHRHMETGDSFVRFCDMVSAGKIEHFTGLTQKEARAGYQRALSLYRREFGQQPPPDIWPTGREKRKLIIGRAMTAAGIVLFIGAVVTQKAGGDPFLSYAVGFGGFFALLFGGWISAKADVEKAASCG
jgi:hypothetical protein